MPVNLDRLRGDHQLWIELFVVFNFAGLAADIFLAHSQNQFRQQAEWIPLYFSIAATVMLAATLPTRDRTPAVWRDVGHLVGWLAVAVGVAGAGVALDNRLFFERAIPRPPYAPPLSP